jgi:hypothetical protein
MTDETETIEAIADQILNGFFWGGIPSRGGEEQGPWVQAIEDALEAAESELRENHAEELIETARDIMENDNPEMWTALRAEAMRRAREGNYDND